MKTNMNCTNRWWFLSTAMVVVLLAWFAFATARAQTITPEAAEETTTANENATTTTTTETAAEELPELGDRSERLLSTAQAKRISQQILRALVKNCLPKPGQQIESPCPPKQGVKYYQHIADPELHAYLNRLGTAIAKNASLRGIKIRVHLVNEPGINASAFVGGLLVFHTGLILSAADENELASVVAHEIAHISQRHLPRMFAKAQANKLPALAAILASIAVGGETGLAGLKLTSAALLSNQLAYTRDFEREADAVGMKLLAQSNFDPTAMARFFNKLESHGGIGSAPEFLRSHPLSYARIAAAQSRAAAYPPVPPRPTRDFKFAQAKIRALYSTDAQSALDDFQARVLKTTGVENDAAVYGLALTQTRLRKFTAARATLQPLLNAQLNAVAVRLADAAIARAAGQPARAAEIYTEILAQNPALNYVAHYQAESLLAAGNAAAAKRALRHQLRRNKDAFMLYPLLAKSNAQLQLFAQAHQASAEYHLALGERAAAVAALKQALRASEEDSYVHRSITARLEELQPKKKSGEQSSQ